MEERIAQLEAKISEVATDMTDVKLSLKEIAASLKSLAVLEEKHNNVTESLKRAFHHLERHDAQLREIEKNMPKVLMSSSWVFAGVLGVMGLLGTLAIAVIVSQLVG